MPRGNMWSSVPLPYCLFKIFDFYVSRAAAPKGAKSVSSDFYAWLEAQKLCPSHGLLLVWPSHCLLRHIIRLDWGLLTVVCKLVESVKACLLALEAWLEASEA